MPAPEQSAAPALALGATAGVLIATQIRINASLGDALGAPLIAALLTFVSGLAVLLVICALRPATRAGLSRLLPSRIPRWMYLGGVIGAANVATFTWVAPTIGIAMFTVAAVTGQMIGGMLVDALGVGARGHRAPTPPRVFGAGLAVLAIVVTQLDRPLGEISVGLIAVALGVNVFVALQLAINGLLNQRARDPVAATTVHFIGAALALALAVGAVAASGGLSIGSWPGEPWLYLGGLFGIALIAMISVTARMINVLRLALVVNGGQLLGALLLDGLVPGGPGITAWLAVGAALTVLAVAVAGIQGRGEQVAGAGPRRSSAANGAGSRSRLAGARQA